MKRELFENDDVTIIVSLTPQGCTQTFLAPAIAAFSNLSDRVEGA